MGRVDYSLKYEAEKTAKAMIYEADISPKASREVSRAIKGMLLKKAVTYLEDVIKMKRPVPFKRYNRNIAHRGNLEKWDAGRYPQKTAKEFIKLIKNAENNAKYKGLDPEKMKIVHIAVKKGRAFKSIFPRAMGRATPKHRDRVTLEMIIEEGD
ncbi:MAG: 50S ribosomal protein L22 [Methanocellales archaeon]